MKQIIKNYTFSPSGKTITFTDFSTIRLDRIILITDVTNSTIIYQFNNTALAGSVSTNVLTLTYNTATGSFNSSDSLQIMYDSLAGDPIYDSATQGNVASGATDSGNPVKVGGKYNSSAPTLSSGQRGDLQLDSSGNLKVNLVTGSTGGTQYAELNTTSPATGTAMLGRYLSAPSGGLTNGQMSMPLMDNYGQLKVVPVGTVTSNLTQVNGSTISLGQTTKSASLPVTLASDQGALSVNLSSGGSVELTDGTNIANVLAPGTAVSSGNALLAAGTTYTTSFSTTSVQAVGSTDAGNYAWVSVQITTQGTSSTVTFQGSNDNTNWYTVALGQALNVTSAPVTSTTTAAVLYHGPLYSRYFRLNVTGISAGTTAGVITYSTTPRGNLSIPSTSVTSTGANQSTTGTITTASSSIASASISGYGGYALVSVHGAYAGVSFGITASDDGGTTFYSTPVYDISAQQWLAPGATISPGTNASKTYWVAVNPNSNEIKVLASAWTSGTANIRIGVGGTSAPPSSMAQIMDAAGNSRGVNVNASNQMGVIDAATSATGAAVSSTATYIGFNGISGNLTGWPGYSIGDASNAVPVVGMRLYNGTNSDSVRSASAASGTTGIGVLAAGAMGIYNSSAPTVTSGNYAQLQLDSSANLKVNIAAGSLTATTTDVADGTLGSSAPTKGVLIAGEDASSNLQASGVVVPGTANSTGNALLTAGTSASVAFSTTTAQAVGSTDAGNYKFVSVGISSQGTSSTITFQVSNDNTNWFTASLMLTNSVGGDLATNTTATGIYYGPLEGRYFRLNVTGISAGTTAGTIIFSSMATAPLNSSVSAHQSGTWTVGSNSATGSSVPTNAFLMGVSDGTNLRALVEPTADAVGPTGMVSAGLMGYNGSTWIRATLGFYSGDGNGVQTGLTTNDQLLVYDGTNWDRIRSASNASGTTGTGLLGAGILGQYNSTAPTVTSGNYNTLQLDSAANLKVTFGGGTAMADGTANPTVPGVASFGMVWDGSTWERMRGDIGDGSAATGLLVNNSMVYNGTTYDRARSATATSGTTGTGIPASGAMGVYNSTAPTATSGDYYQLQLDSSANLYVTAGTGTGQTAPTTAFYEGAQAITSLPTAATAGKMVGISADKFGRQVTLPNGMRDIVSPIPQLTLTSTATETTLITGVASTFNDLLSLVVINTSATATQVDFRDTSGGAIRFSLYIPAGDTRGISLTTPMPQAAVNTTWTAKCGTAVASIIITGSYISNK